MRVHAVENTPIYAMSQTSEHTMTAQAAHAFLQRAGWVALSAASNTAPVQFLAAGEYNENYLVQGQGGPFVLRINHGTQLGLDNQIGYEYNVLELLKGSGVTPRPLHVEPKPQDARLGNGVLLMDFLEGGPLDYRTDLEIAARIFARVHSVTVPPDHGLVVQADPVGDIAKESHGLITRFVDHPLKREQARLLELHAEVLQLRDATRELFASDPMVIVNTEVNSHNFLIPGSEESSNAAGGWLVDWEKAVVSTRFQDLAHFTVATTTRWKRGYTLSEAEKRGFLDVYLSECPGAGMSAGEAWERLMVLERTIVLRALSWCFMAHYEYTRPGRALRNEDTFAKISEYTNDMDGILGNGG